MEFEFSGEMWFWKGPAPWHFITVPVELGRELHGMASAVTYEMVEAVCNASAFAPVPRSAAAARSYAA